MSMARPTVVMMIQRYAAPARTCLLRAATSRVPLLVRRRRALPHQSRMLATQPPLPMSLTGTGCPLGIQMIPTIKQPSGFMGEWMLPPVIPSRFLALVMKDRPPAHEGLLAHMVLGVCVRGTESIVRPVMATTMPRMLRVRAIITTNR